jgi:hypothetical protein
MGSGAQPTEEHSPWAHNSGAPTWKFLNDERGGGFDTTACMTDTPPRYGLAGDGSEAMRAAAKGSVRRDVLIATARSERAGVDSAPGPA